MEQDEYNKEEIDWSYIEFVDNKDILELIEKVASFTCFSCCLLLNNIYIKHLSLLFLLCLRNLVVSLLSWMRLGMALRICIYIVQHVFSLSPFISKFHLN